MIPESELAEMVKTVQRVSVPPKSKSKEVSFADTITSSQLNQLVKTVSQQDEEKEDSIELGSEELADLMTPVKESVEEPS